jgi:NAD(P)-dependent dehydrogenase (short-subunit alcohol dehydrogenase family)
MTNRIDLLNQKVLIAGTDNALRKCVYSAFTDEGADVRAMDPVDTMDRAGVEGIQAAVASEIARLGGLDVLVVSMDVSSQPRLDHAGVEHWDAAFTRPLKSAIFATQAATPTLRNSRGAIVNLGSIIGQMGARPGLSITSAAIACLIHETRMLALRLSPDQVRVNCVCHGYLQDAEITDGPSGGDSKASRSVATEVPFGRLTTPEDVVGTVLFLASGQSRFLTGNIVYADGGTFAGH